MKMAIEAALLTGGKSRRMGQDKAKLLVAGEPLASRIVRLLKESGIASTVLGREPIEGAGFLPDAEDFAGPLAALSRFTPSAEFVFVASCDLPLFDPELVRVLHSKIGSAQAAVPLVEGFRQPLCALYRSEVFAQLPRVLAGENSCAMAWLDALEVVTVSAEELAAEGVDPMSTQGANTPEELQLALERSR